MNFDSEQKFRVFIYMIALYTEDEFNNAKSIDKLPCKCKECGKTFFKEKRVIKRTFNSYDGNTGDFCSKKCVILNKNMSQIVKCNNCGIEIRKTKSQIKLSKSGNHFCSKNCAATYNNVHRKHGTRISKLEIWLQNELNKLYPNLDIVYNQKNIINSELDIYIPSLKLAFELNGIFHYEPIYGSDKLNQIQNNDNRKFQACLDKNIELCIIDTSHQKYFKIETSKKFLKIINDVIKIRQHSLVR